MKSENDSKLVHVLYFTLLIYYFITKLYLIKDITDDNFKRTNACVSNKNNDMLARFSAMSVTKM